MEIPSKDVYNILAEKGVDTIHHANSVITACQFLRTSSLLSRGTVERRSYYQTAQSSDAIDKQLGIWFDVFCDSVDIHHRARAANLYGPVLFALDSKLIRNAYTGRVWVTKLNPTKWAGTKHEERWFVSADDLKRNFVKGRFDQMIVFRHCGGELPFGSYLREIILDDPQMRTIGKIDFYSMAYGAITLAKTEGSVTAQLKKRKCPDQCKCLAAYKSSFDRAREMFFPKSLD